MKVRCSPVLLLPALVFVAWIGLSGCDTVSEPEEAVLLDKDVTFRFEFTSGQIQPGQPATIRSTGTIDLTGQLEGFSKAEIVSARIMSAELERLQPLNVNQLSSIMSEASLRLTSTGLQETLIASQADIPAAVRTAMGVVLTADVAPHLAKPSFGATLRFTPKQMPSDEYALLAKVRLMIAVEGV